MFTINHSFATDLAAIGFPQGVLVHPLHTKYLLGLYGVSGVYMMQGAISLHIVIAASPFKNAKPPAAKETKTNDGHELPDVSQTDVKTARNPDKSSTPGISVTSSKRI